MCCDLPLLVQVLQIWVVERGEGLKGRILVKLLMCLVSHASTHVGVHGGVNKLQRVEEFIGKLWSLGGNVLSTEQVTVGALVIHIEGHSDVGDSFESH